MNLDPQDFLRLVEANNSICFLDIECNGLRGDYHSIILASILPYKDDSPKKYSVDRIGNDKNTVINIRNALERYDAWVTYYGKGFDIPMINTRLLKWGERPVDKRPHIDLYFSLKANLLTARKSQGHLIGWLGLPEEKMSVSADVWAGSASNQKEAKRILMARCVSDTKGLRDLYNRTKHIIREIKK